METNLTKNQKIVLEAIKSFISEKDQAPTFRELIGAVKKRGLALASLNSLVQYLKKLEENGYIQRFPGARGIRLLNEKIKDFIRVPLLGNADCGESLSFAEDVIEDYINVSKKIIKAGRDYFFVRAIGDSMDREGIDGGDYVLVRKGSDFNPGDNILAVINGLGVIKKIVRSGENFMLVPSSTNPRHQPIILHPGDSHLVCGKVEKIFKNPAKD